MPANSIKDRAASTLPLMRGERLRDLLRTAEQHSRAGHLRRAVDFYRKVLAHTDRAVVMEKGRIVLAGASDTLPADTAALSQTLGV